MRSCHYTKLWYLAFGIFIREFLDSMLDVVWSHGDGGNIAAATISENVGHIKNGHMVQDNESIL